MWQMISHNLAYAITRSLTWRSTYNESVRKGGWLYNDAVTLGYLILLVFWAHVVM